MPINPPPGVPLIQFPTPQTSDRVLVELHSAEIASYDPIQPGTPHPNTREFAGYVFVSQRPGRDEKWVQRIWVNERAPQDVYNAEKISLLSDSNAHPIYLRQYTERRDSYTPLPKNAPLTGVYGVLVVSGGAGYTTVPTVIFSGDGSGAAAFAVIFRGAVVGIIITNEGAGYTTAPTVAFTGGNPATTASATALVQSPAAVLIREETTRLGADDPLDSLFIRVTRVYHPLPGPPVVMQSIGEESLIPARYRRQIRTVATAMDVLPSTALPLALTGDQSQIILAQESTTLAKQTIVEETIEENTDPLTGQRTDEQGILTVTGVVVADGTAADSGFTIKSSQVVPFGTGKSLKETETYESPFPNLNGTHVDEATGITVNFIKSIVPAGSVGGVFSGNIYTEINPLDKWRSIQIVSILNEASLPADYTYKTIIRHTFPDVLEADGMEAQVVFSEDGNSNAIGVTFNIIQGYSGPCNARVKEKYMTASEFAAYVAPVVTKFWPEDFTFPVFTISTTRADVSHITVPSSLHPAKILSFGAFGSVTVPATNPPTLPFGSYVYVDIQSEKWRFGVWKVSEIEVLVPTL